MIRTLKIRFGVAPASLAIAFSEIKNLETHSPSIMIKIVKKKCVAGAMFSALLFGAGMGASLLHAAAKARQAFHTGMECQHYTSGNRRNPRTKHGVPVTKEKGQRFVVAV